MREAPPLDPSDEGLHPPGDEENWNESWYFDAISENGELGLYTRVGRLPNMGVCMFTACITGPGRPSVMAVDPAAPLPAEDDAAQVVRTTAARAEHHCEEPLQRFRVAVEATAGAHADHSAPLRAEEGEAADIAFDLTWTTDGAPYRWRYGNRYEVPCRVAGTVRVDGGDVEFEGTGQRDHSWGARDWFAVDWMWSALRLDDGTRIHAVGIPGLPERGVGYIQAGGALTEVKRAESHEDMGANGLIERSRIQLEPGGLDLEIEPQGFGAARLEAPDGRLSLFPRAMCRVRTTDGREGAGWVEWNRVQR